MGAGACSAMGRFPFRAWRSEATPETDGMTDAFESKVVSGLSRAPSTTYGDAQPTGMSFPAPSCRGRQRVVSRPLPVKR